MKLIAGVVVTLMTSALLALGVSAPAQAYHPSIRTFASSAPATNPLRVGQRGTTIVRVSSESGRSPDATLTFTIRRASTGRVVASFTRAYDGGREGYRTPGLSRGRYVVKVFVNPGAHRFYNSSTRHGLRVVR